MASGRMLHRFHIHHRVPLFLWTMMRRMDTSSSLGASLSPRGPRLDWVILGSTLQVRGQTSRPLSVLHCVGSPRSLTMPLTVTYPCSAVSKAQRFLVILGSFWVAYGPKSARVRVLLLAPPVPWLMMLLMAM